MRPEEKPDFLKALSLAFRIARQPLPAADVLDGFWHHLARFPLAVVLHAINRHTATSDYAPTPAALLRALLTQDGRPEADEAWAIAHAALDEAVTVVWSDETAQAWHLVHELAQTDERAAGFAFRTAYTRLVEQARAQGMPVHYTASLGHDPARREATLQAAVDAGFIRIGQAAQSVPALAAPPEPAHETAEAAAQRQSARERLHELVAGIHAAHEQQRSARERELHEAHAATLARKRELAAQAEAHAKGERQ